MKTNATTKASIANSLRKTVGLNKVRYIGLLRSYAEGRTKAGDIDLLLVTDGKLDPSKLMGLTNATFRFIYFDIG